MIGVAGEDLLGAVKLFQQQAAHHEMRPSHRAERKNRVGTLDNRWTEPVGAADGEGECRRAAVAPGGEPVGELAARPELPAFVERDEYRASRHRSEDQLGLVCLQLRRRQLFLLLELDDRRWRLEPFEILGLQLAERAAALFADGEDEGADGQALLPGRFGVGQVRAPHFFKIVMGADFRPEDVDDDVAGVDQHPIALGLALDRGAPFLGQDLEQMLG